MFEPPANCRDIPRGAVNECPLNASMECLIPNVYDGSDSMEMQDGDSEWHCVCGAVMDGIKHRNQCSKCKAVNPKKKVLTF